ncbi:LysE family translocator [Cucumibacter marinus]|uniref:LysE family translocator n=1 Tax=Cucumibacter marinus TaxID=1121252 RepID=UPI000413E9B3|nr:LysE family translocator [Cucumibacter marinus]
MTDPTLILAFALAAFAIELTPGPNMAYLALLSVDRGRLPGLYAVAGVASGLSVLAAIALFGFGALITEYSWIYETLRWAGIGYLLWLALDAYLTSRKPLEETPDVATGFRYFLRGFITNLLNPKALLFYLTVMPSFVAVEARYLAEATVLSIVYVVVATGVHFGVVVLAGTAQPVLSSAQARRRLGIVFALLLVGVAVWVFFGTAR